MAAALLVAAGRGERLGSAGPKALVTLGGRPLLEWSVAALRDVTEVEDIVVALPPGASAPAGTRGVAGGATRSLSVRAALAATSGEPVLVHDAARPLASPALFARALHELELHACEAVVAAARVTDTIKEADAEGAVLATLDRTRLWSIQTPQVFRRAALERALDQPDAVLAAATDDASLVERQGGRVRVVESGPENLKVTSPLDLRLAAMLLGGERPTPC